MDFDRIKERLDQLLAAQRHGELRGALMMLNEVDIAEYLQTLGKDRMLMVFRVLPKDISSDVFSYMDSDQRQDLIESIGDAEVAKLVNDMFIDDAVDFLEEMPANLVKRLLQNTDLERRVLLNQFLRYPENSAGSIMTIEYCEFRKGTKVSRAMEELKRTGIDKETIYTLYVIDDKRQLVGTVPLRRLIMAADDALIDSVMDTGVISVHTLDDQETVADTVRKYDFMSIPVVDQEQRLVGIITVDDIMDVIEEENTEDFEKMGALIPSEDEYMKTDIWGLARNRIPWLLILMISATFTGMIITHYEDVLKTSAIGVVLMSSIPMLMDTGGNCGSQTSVLVIRGLALGELGFKDLFTILWKEIRVAAIVGAVLAAVNFLRMTAIELIVTGGAINWSANVGVWIVVSTSVFLTTVIAKSIGCVLPLAAKRVGLDPALMASPLITTIVDAGALTVLFVIATKFLAV
ncbi:magnesium transporter [Bacillota bacterium Meth-B3]